MKLYKSEKRAVTNDSCNCTGCNFFTPVEPIIFRHIIVQKFIFKLSLVKDLMKGQHSLAHYVQHGYKRYPLHFCDNQEQTIIARLSMQTKRNKLVFLIIAMFFDLSISKTLLYKIQFLLNIFKGFYLL